MVNVQLDLNDPLNPIPKVRKIEISFTAIYEGEDAWNADVLVPQLDDELRRYGKFKLRTWKMVKSWDGEGNEITEDAMRSYIYRKHGHAHGKCSSCPDAIKWKEVERLQLAAYYEDQEILNDMKQGRVKHKVADPDFTVPSPYEKEEDKLRRLRLVEQTKEDRKRLKEASKKSSSWETKSLSRDGKTNITYDPEDDSAAPKLQFQRAAVSAVTTTDKKTKEKK